MTHLTAKTRFFAERLSRESGYRVACLVDERAEDVDVHPFLKTSLTVPACQALGLYCPPDVAWRCGDYGLYLARAQFPEVNHFWMIEYDVRISGSDLGAFFGFFETHDAVDLLAADYRPADEKWYWRHTVPAQNVSIFRCLFPIIRVSASGVDRLLARRRKMSADWPYRISWPNDEIFVATTLSNDGSLCRDLNGFGRIFYRDDTFTFFKPFDGDRLDMGSCDGMIFHPVLYDADYRRKVTKLQVRETRVNRIRRRVAKSLNACRSW